MTDFHDLIDENYKDTDDKNTSRLRFLQESRVTFLLKEVKRINGSVDLKKIE